MATSKNMNLVLTTTQYTYHQSQSECMIRQWTGREWRTWSKLWISVSRFLMLSKIWWQIKLWNRFARTQFVKLELCFSIRRRSRVRKTSWPSWIINSSDNSFKNTQGLQRRLEAASVIRPVKWLMHLNLKDCMKRYKMMIVFQYQDCNSGNLKMRLLNGIQTLLVGIESVGHCANLMWRCAWE